VTTSKRFLALPHVRLGLTVLVLLLAAVGSFAYLKHHRTVAPRKPVIDPLEAQLLRPAAWPAELPMAGDPRHGRLLYAINCSACHGLRGDGKGAAAPHLWPAPRDHTDGGYMNGRTDKELYRSIAHGGLGVGRSALMPAWKTQLDSFEIWNLVAYIRTLHPRIPARYSRSTEHRVIISATRLDRIANTLGSPLFAADQRVVFYRCYDKGGKLAALLSFPTIQLGARTIGLVIEQDATGRIRGSRHHAQVRPDKRAQVQGLVDRAARKSKLQVLAALDQEKDDLREAEAIEKLYAANPQSLPLGQRLYAASCSSCHGVTGRVVGPGVMPRAFKPRNHADASYMNRLSDDYLRSVIRHGGTYWNLSTDMPGTQLKDKELSALVRFIRSLSVRKSDGRCPCGMLASKCSDAVSGQACACRASLCQKMLK